MTKHDPSDLKRLQSRCFTFQFSFCTLMVPQLLQSLKTIQRFIYIKPEWGGPRVALAKEPRSVVSSGPVRLPWRFGEEAKLWLSVVHRGCLHVQQPLLHGQKRCDRQNSQEHARHFLHCISLRPLAGPTYSQGFGSLPVQALECIGGI